jgi:hypothetical protein
MIQIRRSFSVLGLCAGLALMPAPASARAQATGDAASADTRLRALYTEEWNWRQREFGRGEGGRFAPVDAASQTARLEYWTKALDTLKAIPFDQLSPEEKVNAQIFKASIQALADDVRFRTYEAPFNSDTFFWASFTPRQGIAHGRRVPRLPRAPPRRAAPLRRADRQHARGPRARLQRAPGLRRRTRRHHRALHAGGRDESALRALHDDAPEHPRAGAGRACAPRPPR